MLASGVLAPLPTTHTGDPAVWGPPLAALGDDPVAAAAAGYHANEDDRPDAQGHFGGELNGTSDDDIVCGSFGDDELFGDGGDDALFGQGHGDLPEGVPTATTSTAAASSTAAPAATATMPRRRRARRSRP